MLNDTPTLTHYFLLFQLLYPIVISFGNVLYRPRIGLGILRDDGLRVDGGVVLILGDVAVLEHVADGHSCQWDRPRYGGAVTSPIVTLATCADYPTLDDDDRGLPDALRERGIEPRVAVWNDSSINWDDAGVVVLRSVRDYAKKRNYANFLSWSRSVPRLANHPDVVQWNADKHYLSRLAEFGVPMIPTTWLEPSAGYSKHQVHTRFPAHGDFVVKPAISSARPSGSAAAAPTTS